MGRDAVGQSQEGYDNIKIEFLFGEKKIILKPPVITKELVKRKYWFGYKEQYYVDWEYCRMGPMKLEEAQEHINLAFIYK